MDRDINITYREISVALIRHLVMTLHSIAVVKLLDIFTAKSLLERMSNTKMFSNKIISYIYT